MIGRVKQTYLLILLIDIGINVIDGSISGEDIVEDHKIVHRQACPDSKMYRSQWGYCGTGADYCSAVCTAGLCTNGNSDEFGNTNSNANGNIITDQIFACAFNTIDAGTQANRLNGLRTSEWTPTNKDEAAIFLAHVFHQTDGHKIVREYCAPHQFIFTFSQLKNILTNFFIGCAPHYAGSWCSVPGKPDQLYYGRGWFQLSWPCNYHASGQALGVDLLSNPDLVEQRADLAVKTAVWFYNTNNMVGPARQGDFAATTRTINGQLECNGGSDASNQRLRVATYRRIRNCFGLGEPFQTSIMLNFFFLSFEKNLNYHLIEKIEYSGAIINVFSVYFPNVMKTAAFGVYFNVSFFVIYLD